MNLPVSLTRNISRKVLVLKKQSPHIFFVAGVIGSITSTVLACRATLKLSETLDEIRQDLDEVETHKTNLIHSSNFTYTEMEHKKDLAYVYLRSGVKISKLYGPAAIVGVVSIAALTGSHVQMTKRNAALMAAYAAVQKAYDNYRERVREELGDKKEQEIYHSINKEMVDKKQVNVADPDKWSPYARFFDEYNKNWVKDPDYNRLFVQCQQNYANNKLIANGHLFLNEVYDWLGMDRSREGAVVGWIYNSDGDNVVDFGLYEAHSSRFMDGIEPSIILDFNVDGVIYDKI